MGTMVGERGWRRQKHIMLDNLISWHGRKSVSKMFGSSQGEDWTDMRANAILHGL